MAVEGIYVAREVQDSAHLLGQQTRISLLTSGSGGGGCGGSGCDDSLWSLSWTESEDQSSDTNAPISGTSRSLSNEAPHSLEPRVVLRRQPALSRRHPKRAKTIDCFPPLALPRSSSTSPHATVKHSTASGVPAALGLDCLELRRRSRNADISSKWVSHLPRADIERSPISTSSTNSETVCRERHGPVRRIQSLNRYKNSPPSRETCQMSWESLRTKPPRPPTTMHGSNAASPPRMVAETEGRVELEALVPHQEQDPQPEDKLSESKSFYASEVHSTMTFGAMPMDANKKRIKSSLIKQKSEPAVLPCRLGVQKVSSPCTSNIRDAPIPMRVLQTQSTFMPQGIHILKNETTPIMVASPVEASILRIPMIPVTMIAQTSPPPPKLTNQISVESGLNRKGQRQRRIRTSVPCLNQGTSVTLYELMQFCELCTTYIPSSLSNDPLRRNTWEASELIPGLGIRVSVVTVSYFSNSRLPQGWNEDIGLQGLQHTPGSAFALVGRSNRRTSDRNVPPAPLLVVIDDTSVAGSKYFQPGQIILEVNGVNFFSLPVTSKQGLLTRLIAAIFSAYNDRDGNLFITLATPRPRLIRRIDSEILEIRLDE